MLVTFTIPDGVQWVRWRTRASRTEEGRWVTTDLPGERTGPPGKWHAAAGDGHTVCRTGAASGEIPADLELHDGTPEFTEMCVPCAQKLAAGRA